MTEDHTKYHKIQSVWKRNRETGRFLFDQFSIPEFAYLFSNEWEWTEKIDGTNIRIGWGPNGRFIQGRTERAQIPAHLFNELDVMFNPDALAEVFQYPDQQLVLYGEGIGPKIQGCGTRYRSEKPDFVLFDVRIGRWWLKREDVEGIAAKMGLHFAPIVGSGTLQEAAAYTQSGFKSRVAEDGDLDAEGLVLRPTVELFARNGERIITKLKTRDFRL